MSTYYKYSTEITDILGVNWRARIAKEITPQDYIDSEQLVTGWFNHSGFNTLITDGINITSAISSNTWNYIKSNLIDFIPAGTEVNIYFNVAHNSGKLSVVGLFTNVWDSFQSIITGVNDLTFITTQDLHNCVIFIEAQEIVDCSISDVSITKKILNTKTLQATATPLTWQGFPPDDPFERVIYGHRATLQVYTEKFELEDLFTADDFALPFELEHDASGSYELYWKGYIQAASYKEPYDGEPVAADIVAIDGLGLLKNFQFDAWELTGYKTLSFYIHKALQEINYSEFEEHINIYGNGMGNLLSDSPLDQLGASARLFRGKNLHEVVTIILSAFNAIIEVIEGTVVIYRPAELVNATMYGRKFTSATVKSTITRQTQKLIQRGSNKTGIIDVEGGTLLQIPHASGVHMEYDMGWQESALESWDFLFEDFVDLTAGWWKIDPWTSSFIKSPPLTTITSISAEKGVYLNKTENREDCYFQQVIPGVKTRPANFSLSFRYAWHNTDTDSRSIQFGVRIIITPPGSPHLARYYNNVVPPATNPWVTSSDSLGTWCRVFPMSSSPLNWGYTLVAPGWGEWREFEQAINGIPFDGDLTIQIYPNRRSHQYIKVAIQDIKLQFRPASGKADEARIIKTNNSNNGQIQQRKISLSDGHNLARLTVNQLYSYAGILCSFAGSTPINPPKSWHSRGFTQDIELSQLMTNELAAQYSVHRKVIDLPVMIFKRDELLSPCNHIIDTLLTRGGEPCRLKVAIDEFNIRDRQYKLRVTELIADLIPDPPPDPIFIRLNNTNTNQGDVISHEGGVLEIEVDTNDPGGWDTSLSDPDSAVSIYTDSGAPGKTTAGVTIGTSEASTTKTVIITYLADSEPATSLNYTIYQLPPPSDEELLIDETEGDAYYSGMDDAGGSVNITIDATIAWSSQILEDFDEAITSIVPGSGSAGQTGVQVNFNANTDDMPRYFTILFYLTAEPEVSATLYICQNGRGISCPD